MVRSSVGVGSTLTFTARLPLAPEPAPQPVPGRGVAVDAISAASSIGRRALRVLVAEDDETNALIAVAFLERLGAAVERVGDGRAAVRRALREADRPDLVLMDCRMPTMDGYAATRDIRAQELALGLPRVPVVALTATMTDSDRQLCVHAGMDDFLAKPYTIEQIAALLERWGGGATASGGQGQGLAQVEVGMLGVEHQGT